MRNLSSKMAVLICTLLVFVFPAFASAGLVNVLMLDYDTSAGFGNGARYQAALNDLGNTANFGTTGVVNRDLNVLPTVNSLTGVDLSEIGLIIVAHNHQESLLWDDAVAISNHVSVNGASVMALGHSFSDISGTVINDYSNTPNLGNWMTNRFANNSIGSNAYRIPKNLVVEGNATGSDEILDGAFGDLRGELVDSTRNQYWTGSTSGSSGTFALDYRFNNTFIGLDGLFGAYGNGRYMLVGSTNMFGAAEVGIYGDGGTTQVASQYGDANNQAFFKNAADFLTVSTIVVPIPEPSSFVMFLAGSLCLLRRQRFGD